MAGINVIQIAVWSSGYIIVEELGNRLRGRGTESEEVIANRVSRATKELEYQKFYKYVVINDKLEDCVEEIRQIIRSQM